MQYMIIEDYRAGDATAVYRRFAERGRMMPPGLSYVASWVTRDLRRCYQIVACDDRALIDIWTAAWQDLVAFTVEPVIESAEAARLAKS